MLNLGRTEKGEVVAMIKNAALLCLLALGLAGSISGQEGAVPTGIPHMEHVFVVMMENHGYYQAIDNLNERYLNKLISKGKVNLASNYFAVGHPSLTNYLEIVGASVATMPPIGVAQTALRIYRVESLMPTITRTELRALRNLRSPSRLAPFALSRVLERMPRRLRLTTGTRSGPQLPQTDRL